ncbi:hypothetical protein LOK46_32675 (plasmid) [Methylobacterium sp. NMS14P]|uniref:hypothetical protein n=1 Tax=Methylobacterium sp. NMS14P TaxID=2894310 RepID=UPI0023594DB7|nr:hypothetical protein [Methylobacterium sp. NMS14P]WCS28867.1 hypothetical protein LOK46_32675 [Methylobacterium sp. NMS14P]
MSENIVPLRQRGEERSALARVDAAAVVRLAGGQATSLQAARTEVILADLREQRDQMTTLLADLRGRESTGEAQIDDANANLIAVINQGIVQIDLFVARAQVLLAKVTRSGPNQHEAPEQPLADA